MTRKARKTWATNAAWAERQHGYNHLTLLCWLIAYAPTNAEPEWFLFP